VSTINIDAIPIVLPHGKSRDRSKQLADFGRAITAYTKAIGMKAEPRGWGYILENKHQITKDEIDTVEDTVGTCLDSGFISIDDIAHDESREALGVEIPTDCSANEFLRRWLSYVQRCEQAYTPDWFAGMDYYVQMLVEKFDLVTLFRPICSAFHIPIATAKGWSGRIQRAEFGRRFKEAEARGLQCVQLYGGDFDPPGVHIFNNLKKNYDDVKHVVWSDGTTGYDPKNLIVKRFTLTETQIEDLKLPWINNLKTGSKKGLDLADRSHKQHYEAWVQDWLRKVGARKVEANALITHPAEARRICEDTIVQGVPANDQDDVVVTSEGWPGLGEDALLKFEAKKHKIDSEINDLRVKSGLGGALHRWMAFLAEEE
jgi:hypothetical protein